VGMLIDLDHERRMRAPPCPECGGSGPVPAPDWDYEDNMPLGVLLDGLSDAEAQWTIDPEECPQVNGVIDQDW
jgi:hypothetical protein